MQCRALQSKNAEAEMNENDINDLLPALFPLMSFAIIEADFSTVRAVAQDLFAYARRRRRPVDFTMAQRMALFRQRARRLTFFGENRMRLIEPQEGPGVTVLKYDGADAIVRCMSALLPRVEFIEFDSIHAASRRQRHGLYVRKAGKILRRAEASIGFETKGWSWKCVGSPRDWEKTDSHGERKIANRQNRRTLLEQMRALGFDAPLYEAHGEALQEARFRGSAADLFQSRTVERAHSSV